MNTQSVAQPAFAGALDITTLQGQDIKDTVY